MATIKDVAKHAGVSVATVSRVINNRGYLGEEMRKRVNDSMKILNYTPNDLARSLHRQKSNVMGLIVPTVSHPFFGEVTRRIEYHAYEKGYKLMICNSLSDREKERDYIDMLKRSQVDGIVMGSHLLNTEDYENLMLPIVSLDRRLGDSIPYICCDNSQGGSLATKHLIEMGCKNLLHISGSLEIKMLSNLRTDKFIEECEKSGVAYKTYELPDSSVTDFQEEDLIYQMIKENPDCDGVFATSDVIGASVIAAAGRLGRRVPEEIRVVGFDGNIISQLTAPKLTTILQPVDAICEYAVDYLIRMMENQPVPTKTILPVTLLKRGSTGGNDE